MICTRIGYAERLRSTNAFRERTQVFQVFRQQQTLGSIYRCYVFNSNSDASILPTSLLEIASDFVIAPHSDRCLRLRANQNANSAGLAGTVSMPGTRWSLCSPWLPTNHDMCSTTTHVLAEHYL